MLIRGFITASFLHVCEALLYVPHVNLREAFVEEDLC